MCRQRWDCHHKYRSCTPSSSLEEEAAAEEAAAEEVVAEEAAAEEAAAEEAVAEEAAAEDAAVAGMPASSTPVASVRAFKETGATGAAVEEVGPTGERLASENLRLLLWCRRHGLPGKTTTPQRSPLTPFSAATGFTQPTEK